MIAKPFKHPHSEELTDKKVMIHFICSYFLFPDVEPRSQLENEISSYSLFSKVEPRFHLESLWSEGYR